MNKWNYRVVKYTDKSTDVLETYYSIKEVHYKDNVPSSWTESDIITSDSIDGLIKILENIKKCLDKPVLVMVNEDSPLIEEKYIDIT